MFCGQVNARPHRITRRAPAEMLAEERARLHPVPAAPFTAALGVTRKVDALSLVTFEGGQYSVPHELAGQPVWVRRHGEQVVITHAGPAGPAEVARHLVTAPGSPRVDDAHYPPAPPGALNRTPKARTAAEAQFLGIGDGAGLWLAEAAAAGASRVRAKMAQAVQLAALHGAAGAVTGRSGRPPRRAGSPTATWPPSWRTRPARGQARRPGPASRARWPRAPAGGPGTAGRRQPDDTARTPSGRGAHQRGDRGDPPRPDRLLPGPHLGRPPRRPGVRRDAGGGDPGPQKGTAPPAGWPTTSTWPSTTWTSRPPPGARGDRRRPGPAAAGRRAGGSAAPDAAAAHAPHRPRAARHRQGPAVGPRRGAPRAARRGSRRPGPIRAGHPPRPGRLPHREDLRRLGRAPLGGPRRPPRPRCGPWNGSAGTRTWSSAARPAPARPSCSKPSARPPSKPGSTSPGSPWNSSAC